MDKKKKLFLEKFTLKIICKILKTFKYLFIKIYLTWQKKYMRITSQ
jgi:hypothetical protein